MIQHIGLILLHMYGCFWPAPKAPVLVTPKDNEMLTVNPPELHWQAQKGIRRFHLQVSANEDFSTTLIDISGQYIEKYMALPFLPPGKCYWRVRVQNKKSRWSKWSPIQSFSMSVGIVGFTLDCNAQDCVVRDTIVFAECGTDMRMINVSDKSNPQLVSRYPVAGSKIAYADDNIYIVSGFYLNVVGVNNPLGPEYKGHCRIHDYCYGLIAYNWHCFSSTPDRGLIVYDVSDCKNPYKVDSLPLKYAYGIDRIGSFILIASGNVGISVIDISNPKEIKKVGEYDTPDWAGDIVVVGKTALIADQFDIEIVDISELPKIKRACSIKPHTGMAREIAGYGNTMYVVTDLSVEIYDISISSDPVYLGSIFVFKRGEQPFGQSIGVYAVEDAAYLFTGGKGLYIIRAQEN
jgi:hypothetical protein